MSANMMYKYKGTNESKVLSTCEWMKRVRNFGHIFSIETNIYFS